jgi:ariadne-1
MGVAVKRCPKCSQYIEKNGGCDHMKCGHRGCGYEFWWSTLQPYERTSW